MNAPPARPARRVEDAKAEVRLRYLVGTLTPGAATEHLLALDLLRRARPAAPHPFRRRDDPPPR